MSRIILKESGHDVSEKDIRELEEEAGVDLPGDYRSFLLKHNGGRPVPDEFETVDKKIESSVKRFITISNSAHPNLLEEIRAITLAGQIPPNLIPIATNPSEMNRIVISTKGKNVGKVYYWSQDEEDDFETYTKYKPSYKYMRLIAESFGEFLGKLH